MRRIAFIIIFCIPLISHAHAFAEDSKDVIDFTKDDRVLILAPHPDDEVIGTCGVIQKALKQNARVKVVCYTNGDSNELSFIVYEKRLTFKKREFLHMGEVRRKETMRAMVSLGVNPADIIFLGYPDFGTLEIFTKYWGNVTPYKGLFSLLSRRGIQWEVVFGAGIGQLANHQKALEMAKTEWIWRLDDDDVTAIPRQFVDLLALQAAIDCYIKDEDDPSMLIAKYNRRLDQLKRTTRDRQQQSPKYVRRTSNSQGAGGYYL